MFTNVNLSRACCWEIRCSLIGATVCHPSMLSHALNGISTSAPLLRALLMGALCANTGLGLVVGVFACVSVALNIQNRTSIRTHKVCPGSFQAQRNLHRFGIQGMVVIVKDNEVVFLLGFFKICVEFHMFEVFHTDLLSFAISLSSLLWSWWAVSEYRGRREEGERGSGVSPLQFHTY